jgi:hypothetical protein
VVVVLALVELEHRLAALEVAARQQAGLLELHQHPVDRGQADVGVVGQQCLEHVLGGHVALRTALEHLQDLDARQRGLQAAALDLVALVHAPPRIPRILASAPLAVFRVVSCFAPPASGSPPSV